MKDKIVKTKRYQCALHKTKFIYILFESGRQEVIEEKGQNCLSHILEEVTMPLK